MAKQGNLLSKTLVIGIIIFFIGVAVQPSVAIVQPQEEIKGNLKKYLLKRIGDFSTYPEIKSLSERYKSLGIMESLNASNKENYNGINKTLSILIGLFFYFLAFILLIPIIIIMIPVVTYVVLVSLQELYYFIFHNGDSIPLQNQ